MKNSVYNTANAEALFTDTRLNGFGVETNIFDPLICLQAYRELERVGHLVDHMVLWSSQLVASEQTALKGLHRALNGTIEAATGVSGDHIPNIEVRVFEPGKHATKIHRNDPSVGPWVAGAVLFGEGPFNVYAQDQLPHDETIEMTGTDVDPTPLMTCDTVPGTVWSLYTGNESFPHSGGIVTSDTPRVLAVFYGENWSDPVRRQQERQGLA